MPVPSPFRSMAIDAIGDALTLDQIKRLVRAATGKDVFAEFAGPNDPRVLIITKTLDALENAGTERWLLTYILSATAIPKLRELIVKAWPKTLVRLPQADDRVAESLRDLQELLRLPLSPELKFDLSPKQTAFDEIRRRIAALYAYKSFHELLHQLDLKLSVAELNLPVGALQPSLGSLKAQCDVILSQGPELARLLGDGTAEQAVESKWLADLQTMAGSLGSLDGTAGVDAIGRVRDELQRLARVHLARLNKAVFAAADGLCFDALTSDLPLDIEEKEAFGNFVHAIRDLKPTVLARALKHTMWQEAQNEISLIEAFFGVQDEEVVEISKHWFGLKRRVLWLANLDPDDSWAKQVQDFSDGIDDGLLCKKKVDDDIRHQFEMYRNLFRFRFLAIDNTLKLDCGSLRKMDAPLGAILGELA